MVILFSRDNCDFSIYQSGGNFQTGFAGQQNRTSGA
jgi:hypothetical protein